MASLFDEIKKKVVDTTQGAVKATKEMAEASRFYGQINDEKRKINDLHLQIGKTYFEKYGVEAEAPFGEMCKEIVAAYEQIEQLQLEIQRVKGLKNCQNCGEEIALESRFCANCGTESQDEALQQADLKQCENCKGMMDSEAVFCSSCGHKTE